MKNVVLGLPKHMNGDIGIRGEISQDFAHMLENGIKVTLWDERLTTVSAEKLLISGDVSRKNARKSSIRWLPFRFCKTILIVRKISNPVHPVRFSAS